MGGNNTHLSWFLPHNPQVQLECRVLVRTGATGACAPVNFEQRVPGTRQFWSYLGPGAGGLI